MLHSLQHAVVSADAHDDGLSMRISSCTSCDLEHEPARRFRTEDDADVTGHWGPTAEDSQRKTHDIEAQVRDLRQQLNGFDRPAQRTYAGEHRKHWHAGDWAGRERVGSHQQRGESVQSRASAGVRDAGHVPDKKVRCSIHLAC